MEYKNKDKEDIDSKVASCVRNMERDCQKIADELALIVRSGKSPIRSEDEPKREELLNRFADRYCKYRLEEQLLYNSAGLSSMISKDNLGRPFQRDPRRELQPIFEKAGIVTNTSGHDGFTIDPYSVYAINVDNLIHVRLLRNMVEAEAKGSPLIAPIKSFESEYDRWNDDASKKFSGLMSEYLKQRTHLSKKERKQSIAQIAQAALVCQLEEEKYRYGENLGPDRNKDFLSSLDNRLSNDRSLNRRECDFLARWILNEIDEQLLKNTIALESQPADHSVADAILTESRVALEDRLT